MQAIFHLAGKDLRLLLRDRVALFWVVGFPCLFALFLGVVLRAGLSGDKAPVAVSIVAAAGNPSASRFVEELSKSPHLNVTAMSMEEARDAVRRSRAVAYLAVESSAAKPSQVRFELGVDPTKEVEAAFVRAEVERAQARLLPSVGEPTNGSAAIREIAVGKPERTASDYVFPAAILWGLIGCAACFAVSMVAERARGTFLRLAAAPIGKGSILGGKALACGVACVSVSLLMTAVGVLFFDVKILRPDKLGLAFFSTAWCFVGITMLLSLLGRTEQSVAGAGWATLIVMAMLGGAMVPLTFMPDWLVPLSNLSPVKWSIVALEGALWRDFSYAELALPCALLLSVGGSGFAVGLRILSSTLHH